MGNELLNAGAVIKAMQILLNDYTNIFYCKSTYVYILRRDYIYVVYIILVITWKVTKLMELLPYQKHILRVKMVSKYIYVTIFSSR